MKKLPVDELSKLVVGVGQIASLTWNIFEDGTVDFKDIDEVWKIMKSSQCLVSLSFENLKLEWADLDDDEKQHLINEFKKNFEIPNEAIENIVEKIIDIISDLYVIVKKIKNIF